MIARRPVPLPDAQSLFDETLLAYLISFFRTIDRCQPSNPLSITAHAFWYSRVPTRELKKEWESTIHKSLARTPLPLGPFQLELLVISWWTLFAYMPLRRFYTNKAGSTLVVHMQQKRTAMWCRCLPPLPLMPEMPTCFQKSRDFSSPPKTPVCRWVKEAVCLPLEKKKNHSLNRLFLIFRALFYRPSAGPTLSSRHL